MPVLSKRRLSAAVAAAAMTVNAQACEPVFHVPRGFEVQQPRDVSASAAATLHLPANARGAVYTNFVDGRARRPAVAAFRLVDRTTGRRQRVRIAEPAGGSDYGGVYLVEPVGGFVVGHVYSPSQLDAATAKTITAGKISTTLSSGFAMVR
ncbi:MAG TPA: hypothetical protein VIN06_03885 [Devosia sp.]